MVPRAVLNRRRAVGQSGGDGDVCNLYSQTKGQAAIIAMTDRSGNLPPPACALIEQS